MRTAENSLRPVKERPTCLVQIQDREFFWSNIWETPDVKRAVVYAAAEAKERRQAVRVVRGEKREVIRLIEP